MVSPIVSLIIMVSDGSVFLSKLSWFVNLRKFQDSQNKEKCRPHSYQIADYTLSGIELYSDEYILIQLRTSQQKLGSQRNLL